MKLGQPIAEDIQIINEQNIFFLESLPVIGYFYSIIVGNTPTNAI